MTNSHEKLKQRLREQELASVEALRKFTKVMRARFVTPAGSHHDEFYGVEVGSEHEAVCRVSDIEALLRAYDRLKEKASRR